MTPQQLCAKGTESGHQKAVFAWAAMACYKGFDAANNPRCYEPSRDGLPSVVVKMPLAGVPELKWLHSIPNGGARDAKTAALMKAEGARRGVYDICLPVARKGFHGLYIEMKKPGDYAVSGEQKEFGAFLTAQGYAAFVCVGWEQAVKVLQDYLS